MKQILIYLGDQQEKQAGLQLALEPFSIPVTFLNDQALLQTIKSLLNHEPATADTDEHFAIDFMFFDEVSDDEIKAINKAMEQQGIRMPRKAVRTIHNEAWLLKDLLKEIQEEHEYFQILETIHQQLQASASLVIEEYTPASWQVYEQAFFEAYALLQKQATKEEASHALSNLLSAKEHLIKR